jgi:hypothetical protein
MNGTDDLDQLVTAAIDEQMRVRAPADLFDRVRDATHDHPQRPPWLARATGNHLTSPSARPVRLRQREERLMYGTFRLVAALAAVAIAAIVGFTVLAPRGDQSVGGPQPTSAPPTSTPTAVATPMLLDADWGGRRLLRPGTYVTDPEFEVEVTVTVPDGWQGVVAGPYLAILERTNEPGSIAFQKFDKVAVDPCDYTKGFLDPSPGPTVDDLAKALADMPGIEATTPVEVSVDGYRGKQLALTAPSSFRDCTLEDATALVLWELPAGAVATLAQSQTVSVWILDVEGERLVLEISEPASETDEQRAEVEAILESLRLDPGN